MARASHTPQNNVDSQTTQFHYDKNHSGYPTIAPAQDVYFTQSLNYKTSLISPSALVKMDKETKDYIENLKDEFKNDFINSNYIAAPRQLIALVSQAFRLKDLNSELSAKLSPVITNIKREGLLEFLKANADDPLLEIAKRALIPNYKTVECPTLLERFSANMNFILGDSFTKNLFNTVLFTTHSIMSIIVQAAPETPNFAERMSENPMTPLRTMERHIKIIVARELGLISDRQATVMRSLRNNEEQDKEVKGLTQEISAAVDILSKATDAGILRETTANRRFESILRNKALDIIRSKLREIDGQTGISAAKLNIESANWEDWDKLITPGEITKAHRVAGS